MTLSIPFPFSEEEEIRKHKVAHKAWREWLKRNFSYLLEELENDYLENPCADNEEVYLDVKMFLDDYDELDVDTICWMRDEYRLYAKKYELRFY